MAAGTTRRATAQYLSHLSYANFMNPQQTPSGHVTLLAGRDRPRRRSGSTSASSTRRCTAPISHACRQAPEGYFYVTVFDKWSKDEH